MTGRMRKYVRRAAQGLRQDARLHLTATTSLAVALLCLATFLLCLTNLQRTFETWGGRYQVSVYLRDGASGEEIERLRTAIGRIPEVRSIRYVSAQDARRRFLDGYRTDEGLAGAMTADLFPASLELRILPGHSSRARADTLAARIGRLPGVEQVETYRDFFDRLLGLIAAGKLALLLLGGIVVVAGLCIGANTARLTLARRREEIEILRLCGATDQFVRLPFLLEGAVEGLAGAAAAVVLLALMFLIAREPMGELLPALGVLRPRFLGPGAIGALLVSGALLGAVGSHAVLRKPLEVG